MQFEVVENPKRHSESFSFCYVHCVKSIQIHSFFLVCIFLYSDWIWRDTLTLLDRICKKMTRKPLREKCPNTELFLVRIYCIRTEYGEILRFRYSISLRIQSEYRKIRTRNNSVFGHFSRSGFLVIFLQIQSNKVSSCESHFFVAKINST